MRIVADDLSGAAEAAGVLSRHGLPAIVALEPGLSSDSATVLDVHVRNAVRGASARIREGMSSGERVDYVKIDSQLRGPVSLFVQAAGEKAAVVLAPALPRLRRTVEHGALLLDGAPLHSSPSSAWKSEASPPPRHLSDVIPPSLPRRHFPLSALRSGEFAQELAQGERGEVFVPDACSAEDLDAIAAAIVLAPRAVIPIGSAGLLEAMVVAPGPAQPPRPPVAPDTAARKVVVVLGSLEPVVDSQRAALGMDATTVVVRSDMEHAAVVALIAAALERETRTVVVMAAASRGPHDVSIAQRIGRATADAVSHDPHIAMALIGGETARQTLDSSDERVLRVVGEVHPGAVLSVTARGRFIATRPGSFGALDSLRQITTTLLGAAPRDRQEEGSP